MKFATMMVAASLAALAVADEPAAKAPEARPGKPPAGERAPGRPGGVNRPPRPMSIQDPLLRAVSDPKVAEKIGLTEEQKAKLGNPAELREQRHTLRKAVEAAEKRQMELLRAKPIDEAAMMTAIDALYEARKTQAKEQTKRLILVLSVLTPEQVTKAREILMEMRTAGKKPGARDRKPPKDDGSKRPGPPPPPPDGPKGE